MTTKFSEGMIVRAYERSQSVDGVVDGIWPDGTIRVRLDASEAVISYHPKQLRRLVKRKKVVWESADPIKSNKYGRPAFSNDDDNHRFDDLFLNPENLKPFIGKRIRIVIAEAREKK